MAEVNTEEVAWRNSMAAFAAPAWPSASFALPLMITSKSKSSSMMMISAGAAVPVSVPLLHEAVMSNVSSPSATVSLLIANPGKST